MKRTQAALAAESPDGFAFGAAAIKLPRLFRVREDSRVPGAHVDIPIDVRLAR